MSNAPDPSNTTPAPAAAKTQPAAEAAPGAAAPGANPGDSLQQLGEASRRYAQGINDAQAEATKTWYDLLDNLGKTLQSIAQDRSASDLITRYQIELMRSVRTQDLSDLQNQYVDTVQKLAKLQEQQSARLRAAIEDLQSKASSTAEQQVQAAERAQTDFQQSIKSIAGSEALRALAPDAMARLGYGLLAAAVVKAQAAKA